MKVVLSRKGFDTENGGIPSIILPNKELLSFPIPSDSDSIKFTDLNHPIYGNYFEIINNLKPNQLKKNQTCHLDPDIYQYIRKRENNWQPIFGPYFRAYSHLKEHNIKENDIFLFFGSFKESELNNSTLVYKKGAQEKHIIFGYFQIGKIVKENRFVQDWMVYHPHVPPNRNIDENNVVFIATNKLSFNNQLPGASALHYLTKEIVLTKKDGDRYLSKSKWNFSSYTFGKKIEISYHQNDNWRKEYFQSAKRGQEFVLEETKDVEKWAQTIINSNYIPL